MLSPGRRADGKIDDAAAMVNLAMSGASLSRGNVRARRYVGERLMVNRVSDHPGRSGADNGYQPGPTLLLHVQNVDKQYGSGANAVTALRHVNLAVGDGQFIAIRG